MAVYTLPDLPYDFAALEPAMSGQILELHHDKHHAAYVKGANDTLDQIAEIGDSATPVQIVGLERTLAFNISGHVLHSQFWTNLSPDGGDRPDRDLGAAIDESFGSFDSFKKRLTTATVAVQGSGWGVLGYEPLSGQLIIEQLYDHQGNGALGATPRLVVDAWEHAYYLQYKNVRPDYVQQLWTIVNWEDVQRRLTAAVAAKPL